MSINVDKMKNDFREVLYQPADNGEQLKPVQIKRPNDTLFLHLSVLTANLILFSGAADMVWISPVLPKLESNDTSINPLGRQITYYEVSMVAGLPAFTSILGGIVFMRLPDLVGRRKSLIYMAVGMLLSEMAVVFIGNIYLYYVAKSFFSLFLGAVFVVLPVYLSEISEDHNRVKFGCLMGVTLPAGNLYSYIVGPLTSVPMFTFLCVAPLIPCLLCFVFLVPETPFYLASRNNHNGAIKALSKLRSNKSKDEIKADYEELKVIKLAVCSQKLTYCSLFETHALRRALLIASGVNLAQYCSGVAAIMSFLEPIFNEAGTNLSGSTVSLLVGCVNIIVYTITSFSVEKLGRRPLLLFSCASSGIPLFVLGLCFYWKGNNPTLLADVQWLPLACILTFVVVYAVGLGPIPVTLVGALFPSDVVSVAMSFISTLVGIVIFIVLSLFPIAAEYLGLHFCMWVFSINCLGFSCFIYFMLPETKGKSVSEMQNIICIK